jgi:hypothetical protein
LRSGAQRSARNSLLEQQMEAEAQAEARKKMLSQLRRTVQIGRRSLLSPFADEGDIIGA